MFTIDVEHVCQKMLQFTVHGGLWNDSDRTVTRQKSLKLLNWEVLVGCSNMNYEKPVVIINPVTMHEAH